MNWKKGDKAYCTRRFRWKGPNGSPQPGTIYLVTGTNWDGKTVGLHLAGLPTGDGNTGWRENGFHRIVTRTDQERANATAERPIE